MKNSLRTARARTDITQARLAEACSVSRQTVNTIESGKYVPSTVLALKMARALSTTVEDLFQLEDDD